MTIAVDEHPCLAHATDPAAPCGAIWYQFTAHTHTLGACCRMVPNDDENAETPFRYEPLVEPVTGTVDVDETTGVATLTLADAQGPVSIMRLRP